MLNAVSLVGRITKDPELRYTNTQKAVVSFSLAVERDFKDQSGNKQTDFFNIVAWGKTAEFISKYVSKGRLLAVNGRLETRNYTDKNGNKQYVTEIVASNVYALDSAKQQSQPEQTEAPMTEYDDDDADLPF